VVKQRGKPIAERFNPRDTMEWHQWIARFTMPKPNDKEVMVVVRRADGTVRDTKRVRTEGLQFEEGYRHDLFDL
jgi:hypothetical protein